MDGGDVSVSGDLSHMNWGNLACGVYNTRSITILLMHIAKVFGGDLWVLGLLEECISPEFPGGLSGPPYLLLWREKVWSHGKTRCEGKVFFVCVYKRPHGHMKDQEL